MDSSTTSEFAERLRTRQSLYRSIAWPVVNDRLDELKRVCRRVLSIPNDKFSQLDLMLLRIAIAGLPRHMEGYFARQLELIRIRKAQERCTKIHSTPRATIARKQSKSLAALAAAQEDL